MASNYGLGPDYDIALGVAPLDFSTARTGLRINMAEVKSVDFVVVKGVGTEAEDPTFTLQAHTASSGGTPLELAVIDEYFVKSAVALAGTETWTKVTQDAAATVVDPGDAGTSAEHQQLVVFNVRAEQLPTTHNYLSVNVADVGDAAQIGTVLYIIHKHDKGDPTTFPAPLR